MIPLVDDRFGKHRDALQTGWDIIWRLGSEDSNASADVIGVILYWILTPGGARRKEERAKGKGQRAEGRSKGKEQEQRAEGEGQRAKSSKGKRAKGREPRQRPKYQELSTKN